MKLKALSKMLSIILAVMMALAMTACGQTSPVQTSSEAPADEPAVVTTQTPAATPGPVELTVFAAASMTETLAEIAKMYKTVAPNVSIVFNFDSSGTLQTQIEEGAVCDLFISAAQKQMNALEALSSDGDPNGRNFVEQGTRVNLLENKVVLVVPEGNPKDIASFEDLVEKLKAGEVLMAMGNGDVPVGQYTQKILDYFNLNEEELAEAGSITYGSNVKEVTTQVYEKSVDCGVVYATDAYSAGLALVDTATKEMCGQVIYPAAVMETSQNKAAAQTFLDYLKTDECMAVFEKVGFSPAE